MQRGRESFSANDLPRGKRGTRKRLPTSFARFHQAISGRVLTTQAGPKLDAIGKRKYGSRSAIGTHSGTVQAHLE